MGRFRPDPLREGLDRLHRWDIRVGGWREFEAILSDLDALASGNRDRAQEAFFRHVERSRLRFLSTVE